MGSEMCSLHLTHPNWSSGQPTAAPGEQFGVSVPCSRVGALPCLTSLLCFKLLSPRPGRGLAVCPLQR